MLVKKLLRYWDQPTSWPNVSAGEYYSEINALEEISLTPLVYHGSV